MQDPGSQRKNKRIAARKGQILGAAAQLFAQKGFHRTTTRDIADAAEMAEGTLYNYFSSKDDLMMGIVNRLAEAQVNSTFEQEYLPMDARQFFFRILSQSHSFMDDHHEMLQSVLSEVLSNPDLRAEYCHQLIEPFTEMLEQQVSLRIQLGQIKDVQADLVSRMLVGTLLGLYLLDTFGDEVVRNHWEDLSSAYTEMIFDGVDKNVEK